MNPYVVSKLKAIVSAKYDIAKVENSPEYFKVNDTPMTFKYDGSRLSVYWKGVYLPLSYHDKCEIRNAIDEKIRDFYECKETQQELDILEFQVEAIRND